MQNSNVAFILSALEWKCLFWANVFQKIKIVSLSWKLVVRPIRIWRIQWWRSFFSFFFVFDRKDFFFNLLQKSKLFIEAVILDLDYVKYVQLDGNFRLFLGRKYLFWVNLVQKFKRVSLRQNLVPRLILKCKVLWWCSFTFYFRSFLQVLSKKWIRHFDVTWLISQQFPCTDLKSVVFIVNIYFVLTKFIV